MAGSAAVVPLALPRRPSLRASAHTTQPACPRGPLSARNAWPGTAGPLPRRASSSASLRRSFVQPRRRARATLVRRPELHFLLHWPSGSLLVLVVVLLTTQNFY